MFIIKTNRNVNINNIYNFTDENKKQPVEEK